jgi:hypothetical protein
VFVAFDLNILAELSVVSVQAATRKEVCSGKQASHSSEVKTQRDSHAKIEYLKYTGSFASAPSFVPL